MGGERSTVLREEPSTEVADIVDTRVEGLSWEHAA